jgi:UDP-GlcNAc:undecaprenyl-phosphate GlcNAc-1-phosphate transferase
MAKIGFSQRKTVAYLYTWTVMLAGVAIALRFVPYSQHYNAVVRIPHYVRHLHHFRLIRFPITEHHYILGWSVLMGAILVGALIASVYLVYVLEILKFRGLRSVQIRRVAPEATDEEIDEDVARDVGTGEFEAVRK